MKFSHPWQFILHNTRQISGHRNSLCQWFDSNFLLFTSSLYKLLNIYTCSRSVFSMYTISISMTEYWGFLDFNPDGKNNRVIIRFVDFILYHCYLLENMKYHWIRHKNPRSNAIYLKISSISISDTNISSLLIIEKIFASSGKINQCKLH